jgi:hypothetical protein
MRPFQGGEWLLSRRDRLIVGRHEVPEKSFPERTVPQGTVWSGAANRPCKAKGVLKYLGLFLRSKLLHSAIGGHSSIDDCRPMGNQHQSSNRCAHLQESDRTLRDGSFSGWRTFPGTLCQATIMLSLRDEIHSQHRGFD